MRISRRPSGPHGDRSRPVLHACTRTLPEDRGDYGSGAVELLGADDVFVSLLEFGPESVGTALFARQGLPRPLPLNSFSPTRLQRTLPGQSGLQIFFTDNGRAFCLYVVLGAHSRRVSLLPKAEQLVTSLAIASEPADTAAVTGGPR
ncbi:MAG TPA: hypothetical protein VLR26_06125 [Frankiaceae bacterium]|nr:hypothetical protein [Frankiaceae bacterium]